jgi:hypothetical protein
MISVPLGAWAAISEVGVAQYCAAEVGKVLREDGGSLVRAENCYGCCVCVCVRGFEWSVASWF